MTTKIRRKVFDTVSHLVMYLRNNTKTVFELEADDVFVSGAPAEYIPLLKKHKKEIVSVLKDWKGVYISRLKELQQEGTEQFDLYCDGIASDFNSIYYITSFIELEKHLMNGYDYGNSCIYEEGVCPEVMMCCHYCSTTGNWSKQ